MSTNTYQAEVFVKDAYILGTSLQDLGAAHPDWVMGRARHDVIYALPEPAIHRLSFCGPERPALLDDRQAAAERDFAGLCRKMQAIGLAGGKFLQQTPFEPHCRVNLEGAFSSYGAGPMAELSAILDGMSVEVAERQMAYIGWLLTEPMFLRERDHLRELWLQFPAGRRPSLPLRRPWKDWDVPTGRRDVPEPGDVPAQEFGVALVRLLHKWQLMYLATWDVPVPQGPLVPNLLPPSSPASPDGGVKLCLPTWYSARAADDLASQIRGVQEQAARDLGVDPTGSGLAHVQAYARMARIIHLEQAMRSRFDELSPPRGLVARIADAVADELLLGTEQVAKYRKAIARCIKGERSLVPMLKSKTA
jgi:hypothetical protein